MATQKEIALYGAFLLKHNFVNNMSIVKMSSDSIYEQQVRHVCLARQGFSFLTPREVIVQDKLVFYRVRLWTCEGCGKLYWYNEEVSRLVGMEASQYRLQAKMAEMYGMDTRTVPPESFYTVIMVDDSTQAETYNPVLAGDIQEQYTNPMTSPPVDSRGTYSYDLDKNDTFLNEILTGDSQEEQESKEKVNDIQASFDDLPW